MKRFCRAIARNMMISRLRKAKAKKHKKSGPVVVGLCENPDAFTPLEYGSEKRDPIDARRQLEALAQLCRKGRMPEHGADIIEGVACGCTHPEIGADLGITAGTVEGRVRRMRERSRKRMVNLGIFRAGVGGRQGERKITTARTRFCD